MISGCAGTKQTVEGPQIEALSSQKLSSSFKRQGVKIEWECSWGTGLVPSLCVKGDFRAIEVTGYATSNGNSENNREDAFRVAELQAKAKLRRFLAEDVSSTTVVNTLTKNIEKANDRIKNRIRNAEEVALSDEDAMKESNWAVRENSNDIARTVTESIRINASGILKGVYVAEEKVVDRQTVAVTIRWDKDSERAGNYLKSKFR
jgi:hypothetical protein